MAGGFKKAFAKAYLAEDQPRRYEVRKGDSGWIFYEDLAQLSQDKLLVCNTIPAGEYLQFGNQEVSTTVVIDRKYLKGIILRPLDAWMTEEEVAGQYEVGPEEGEHEYQESEDGLGIEVLQTVTGADPAEPLVSSVDFAGPACPNVFFTVGIKRPAVAQEAVDEMRAANDYSNATWGFIVFGGTAWALVLPPQGQPLLCENVSTMPRPPGFKGEWPITWKAHPWTEGQLSQLDVNSFADEGKLYRIGVIGHAICVTESDFSDDFAYYVVPNRAQPIIPSGTITVYSWPGQSAIRLDPIEFRQAKIWRYPFWVEDVAMERRRWQIWGEQLTAGVTGGGASLNVTECATAPGSLEWTLTIDPQDQAEGPPLLAVSHTTPFIQSITIVQEPVVTDNGEPFWTELDYPYELGSASQLGASTAGSYSLVVDNRLSLSTAGERADASGPLPPTVLLRPGRQVKLEWGWQDTDDMEEKAEAAQCWAVEVQRDSKAAKVEMTDLLGMLALSRWRHGSLSLIGFQTAYAMRLLLMLEGFGPDWYDLEDFNEVLYGNQNPANETWSFDEGAVVADILAEIVQYGMHNGALWYDGSTNKLKTGCRYCRTKRTAATWASHADKGWQSSGCLAADIARNGTGVDLHLVAGSLGVAEEYQENWGVIERLVVSEPVIKEREYANAIQVWGQAPDGRKLGAWIRNESAIWRPPGPDPDYGGMYGRTYVGWPIWYREEVRHATTQTEVCQRCSELAHELFPWPLVFRDAQIPFNHEIKPGWVVQIEGSDATDAKGRRFRITSVRPDVGSSKMFIDGHEIGWPVTET